MVPKIGWNMFLEAIPFTLAQYGARVIYGDPFHARNHGLPKHTNSTQAVQTSS